MTLKCNGLQDGGGLPLNESGRHLDLSATLDDGAVDVTVITLPVRLVLAPIVDGKVTLDLPRIELADPVDVTLEKAR